MVAAPVGRAIIQPRHLSPTDVEQPVILHWNHRRVPWILLPAAPPEVRPDSPARLEQHAARQRRLPVHETEDVRMVLDCALALRRCYQSGERLARERTALDAVLADVLLVHPRVDLVARRRLPRQPHRSVLPRPIVDGLLVEIR